MKVVVVVVVVTSRGASNYNSRENSEKYIILLKCVLQSLFKFCLGNKFSHRIPPYMVNSLMIA
jgi:hypothetical protein